MGMRYTFIDPERPARQSLRDTLAASLAIPADNLKLADAIGDVESAISDATSALIDAETPAQIAAVLHTHKRAAFTMLALIAAFEGTDLQSLIANSLRPTVVPAFEAGPVSSSLTQIG